MIYVCVYDAAQNQPPLTFSPVAYTEETFYRVYLKKDATSFVPEKQINSPHMEVFQLLGYGAILHTGRRPLDLIFGDPRRLATRNSGVPQFIFGLLAS